MALISSKERFCVLSMKTDVISICDYTVFPGRNIYSHRPVVKMVVDIGKFGNIPTKYIKGFNEKLLSAFPGLQTNCCGLGFEGGFLKRLTSGTCLGHVLEHVILEMQYMLGYDVRYGKTRVIKEPNIYYLVFEYLNEVCAMECAKAAVFILNRFIRGENADIRNIFDHLARVSLDGELGPSTMAIVNEAKKRNIPVERIGHESFVRLGYGKYSRIIESTLTDATSCISADIASNKQLTKSLLKEHGIPTPSGKVVFSEISAVMAAEQIGKPIVIKPFDSNQGKGVYLNLKTISEIKEAFKNASKFSNGIIVERFIPGRDFRILVVGGRVSAAAERLPASVTGDGRHTIKELVNIVNSDINRGEHHEKPLTKIKLDSMTIDLLQKHGLCENSIPKKGQIITLRQNGNLSTGGTAIDCTDIIHPENAKLAVEAAKAIGIDIAGIDIVAEDISKPIKSTGGAIVEVNAAPGIRMHLYPSVGKPRNVAKDIINFLFPSDIDCQVPIVSVTGTNGKTTTVRLIHHVLKLCGKTVGMTNTSGSYIGDKCICRGDNSGPLSAKLLLSNKEIDAAVLETARGGIIRKGLGYDLADVGIITNITEDHLGLDGIETLEDLAFVKSLVVEAVKENGAAVLNAEDSMTPWILKRVKARLFLFYKCKKPAWLGEINEYVSAFTNNGKIKINDRERTLEVIDVDDIPITCGGLVECNIENCLAAVSGLYALGVPVAVISDGLRSFTDNAGRFNLYELDGFRIMLDYGHNPAGYEQVIKSCKKLGWNNLIGVIGMPGDRQDSAIRAVGEMCADAFSRIIIKEDEDLRGRKPGDVAGIFHDSILSRGYDKNAVTIINREFDAVKAAISLASSGDLVVILYEKLEPIQKYLESLGAKKTVPLGLPDRKQFEATI